MKAKNKNLTSFTDTADKNMVNAEMQNGSSGSRNLKLFNLVCSLKKQGQNLV